MNPNSPAASEHGVVTRAGASGTIRFDRLLPHPIGRVWAAITTSEGLADWWLPFPADIKIDLAVGGVLTFSASEFGGEPLRCTVLELDPPHRLVHTHFDPAITLCWELAEEGAGCRLRLTQHMPDIGAALEQGQAVGLHHSLDRLGPALDGAPQPWDWDRLPVLQQEYQQRTGIKARPATAAPHEVRLGPVATVVVPVRDQDAALAFYVDRLGMRKFHDMIYPTGERWLEVSPAPGSANLCLVKSRPERPSGVDTGIVLFSADVQGDLQQLQACGVQTDVRPLPEGEVLWWSGAPLAGVPTQFRVQDPDGNSFLIVQSPVHVDEASDARPDAGPEQRHLVEEYIEGFRASDHARVLSTLTDDVEWVIHGHRTTVGKEEFDGEIENPAFTGSPQLDVQRVHQDGTTVIVTGEGRGATAEHGPFRFAFNVVFSFRGGLIARVDSYVVPLS